MSALAMPAGMLQQIKVLDLTELVWKQPYGASMQAVISALMKLDNCVYGDCQGV